MLKVFGRLCDEGCSVLVCPGAKFCSWLQSFALRGSAECRWDRGESSQMEVKSRWGREKRKGESESGCSLVLDLNGNGLIRTSVSGAGSIRDCREQYN